MDIFFLSGVTTLAFQAQTPAELIKRLGDWPSDAYRSYIHIPVKDKMQAVKRQPSFFLDFFLVVLFRLRVGRTSLGIMLLNGRVHFGALPCVPQT